MSISIPKRVENVIGRRLGKLEVVEFLGTNGNYAIWKCICDCGNTRILARSGFKKARCCGCERSKNQSERATRLGTKHGLSKLRIFAIHKHMLSRCNNRNNDRYASYGGRGIKVCKRWLNVENFLKDMGHPQSHQSIDRVNPNKGYNKGNCRWATAFEQARSKTTNIKISHKGKTQCAADWDKELGFARGTICRRMKSGWDIERALTPFRDLNPPRLYSYA